MVKYDLLSCYDFIDGFNAQTDFTRYDSRSKSLLDGIIFSSSLADYLLNVEILHYGNNISDHLPVMMKMSLDVHTLSNIELGTHRETNCIPWPKLKIEEVDLFRTVMDSFLDDIFVPLDSILHGCSICTSNDHLLQIENYYARIIHCINIAETCLPRKLPSHQRAFWHDGLTVLKNESIVANRLWRDAGSPSHGDLFRKKKEANLIYKREIRNCQSRYNKINSESLYHDLTNKNQVNFWKTWNKINAVKVPPVPRVNGFVTDQEIANSFSHEFKKIYDNADSHGNNDLKVRFDEIFPTYFQSHRNDNIRTFFLSWSEMTDIVRKLKSCKSAAGNIRNEHLLYGSHKLLIHLQLLFNSLIQHGYVVHDFLEGEISPIIKDRAGDVNSSDNYRGITLSSSFAQMFESALRLKFGYFLQSNSLQFGFKHGMSTSHALFSLKGH